MQALPQGSSSSSCGSGGPEKSTTPRDFQQLAWIITRQPVDHSATYLSIACLNLVRHLSDVRRASLTIKCPVKFDQLLGSDADQDSWRWFSASMAFMYEEVRAVSNNFPMTKDATLRLAGTTNIPRSGYGGIT